MPRRDPPQGTLDRRPTLTAHESADGRQQSEAVLTRIKARSEKSEQYSYPAQSRRLRLTFYPSTTQLGSSSLLNRQYVSYNRSILEV